MKPITALLLACSFCLPLSNVVAQPENHPLEEIVGQRLSSTNLFLLWQEDVVGGTQAKQKVYSYDGDRPQDERLVAIPGVSDGPPVDGNRQMVAASGQFNVDPYDDVVAAWEGEGQHIELFIPHFDTTDAMWNASSVLTVAEPAAGSAAKGVIHLETGDLDGDGLDEFVLVYQDNQNRIRLQVYDTDGTLTPELKAWNADEMVSDVAGVNEATPFAVTVGDVNDDGIDEIIQVGIDSDDESWALYWKVYAYNGSTLDVLARATGFNGPTSLDYTIVHYAVEAARLRSGRPDEFFFVWSFDVRTPAPNTADDTFVYLLSYDVDSGTFIFNASAPDARLEYDAVKATATMDPLAISKGDLDGNGLEEIVVAFEEDQYVFSSDAFLNLTQRSTFQLLQAFESSYDYVATGDVNQDGIDEVFVGKLSRATSIEEFTIHVWSTYSAEEGWLSQGESIGYLKEDERIDLDSKGFRRFAMATGSFDGHDFTIGEPLHSIASNASQPLVILNAPPIHFDVFGGETFDVNSCYSEDGCGFEATYEKTDATSTEVKTEVTKDWGVSAGLGYSGEVTAAPMGVGVSFEVESYFDLKYGKNFSKEDTESETVTVSVEIGAVEDDVIYATVTDYDIWQYPVYHGTEDFPRRYIMVPEPRHTEARWFPSKTWSGNAYIPDHEVGNILSYPAYPDLGDNPNVDQNIRASYQSDTFVLGANPTYTWNLSIENFTESSADTTREQGFDSKLHVGVVRLSGDYTDTNMSTHKTTVTDGLNLSVALGGIDRSFGETEYRVTPYAYWAKNGALVVDYAVQPERAGAGGSNTWWDDRYGADPDPALILPWRYDPEKGFGIGDEAKRHQTKDVIFDNPAPQPGDTLTLTARVRNFSLVGTAEPVTVHFYVGDPDAGGTPIVGLDGETSVSTATAIPAQRWAEAGMSWKVPPDLDGHPRIYAVLDQDDAIAEIHANNNKGFNILNLSGSTAIDDPDDVVPGEVTLEPAYPNPFTERTTVPFSVGTTGHVTIEVYDVLGRRIETLERGLRQAGRHTAVWEAERYASGLYFMVLQANSTRQTVKVLLMK